MENSLSILLENYTDPLEGDSNGSPSTSSFIPPASSPTTPDWAALSLVQATDETKRRSCFPCDWYDIGVGIMLLASAVSAVYCFLRILQP